jgi:hypothetical protein
MLERAPLKKAAKNTELLAPTTYTVSTSASIVGGSDVSIRSDDWSTVPRNVFNAWRGLNVGDSKKMMPWLVSMPISHPARYRNNPEKKDLK